VSPYTEPQDWRRLFEEISISRLASTDNCTAVVTKIAGVLVEFGYRVQLREFVAGPERLVAGSVFGVLLIVGSVIAAATLLAVPSATRVPGVMVALVVLVLVAGLPGAVEALVAGGRLYAPWVGSLLGYRLVARGVSTANITAVKRADPRVWLVAHSDSKVQRSSLATRMVAVRLVEVGALLLALSGAFGSLKAHRAVLTAGTVLGAALAVAGGAVLATAGIDDGSPGAIDNATGIVAALAAAKQLGDRDDVGILITGAEELAMAGARQWVRDGACGRLFVNFDGVDGRGRYVLSVHRGASPGSARTLASRLRDTLGREDARIVKYITFGMFVDGMILAKAGLAGVTVQRGTFAGTAGVAHTPRDVASRVDIEGALRAGRAAASAIESCLSEGA